MKINMHGAPFHAGCFERVDLVLFNARVAATLAFTFKVTKLLALFENHRNRLERLDRLPLLLFVDLE